MPAEIGTGGHRVLHCDSHADRPIAISIYVPSPSSDERRINRVNSPVKTVFNDDKLNESQGEAPKDQPQKTERRVRKAESSDRGRGKNPSCNHGESSPTRILRIAGKKETVQGGRHFLAKSGASQRQRRGGGGEEDGDGFLGACRASRESPYGNEDVTRDERFSVTWSSREDAGEDGRLVRGTESRLHRDDGTERYRLAVADVRVNTIARRRSLRNRSWTRPRPSSSRGSRAALDADLIGDQPRTTGGDPPLSSHHSRAIRAEVEIYGDGRRDVDERFLGVKFGSETRTDEDERSDDPGRRDVRPEDRRDKRPGQDSTDRKRLDRVRSFLQLAVLVFLIAFGRYGPLGSSSVLGVSARPVANGLSVLGIIGAVNARSVDLTGDAGTRAERSANLSHITGTSRKIQMYIMNRHLQILPDGTVNGAKNDSSIYTF
ncbi:uncharacterized protein LOC118648073 [Monomorium pharaonis]|uniref:uncharacterized protein LOC118648073 n=1 Tax=Monomorium pharaonis TaxID=307658 RepID=UPI00174614F4|nr:uncharacterized protein LOC118648073 [Monomorium pharaonis]